MSPESKSEMRSDEMILDELIKVRYDEIRRTLTRSDELRLLRLWVCLHRRALKACHGEKKNKVFLVEQGVSSSTYIRRNGCKKKTVHRGDLRKKLEIFSSSRLKIKIRPSGVKKPLKSRRLPAWIAGWRHHDIQVKSE